jgi:hypothetical protein
VVDLNVPGSRVRAVLEGIFVPVAAIAAAFLAQRQNCRAVNAVLTADRLSGLREIIWHQLSLLPAADGAGVVAAPGVIADRHRHLEWWQRTASADGDPVGFARIRLNLDPESIDLYDYLDMDWYTVPRLAGRRHVFGPYVDFSGADRYVLTLTVPVFDDPAPAARVPAGAAPPPRTPTDPEFLGVAGADMRMSKLEPKLLAILRSVPVPAVLVTPERRVIAANTPQMDLRHPPRPPPRPRSRWFHDRRRDRRRQRLDPRLHSGPVSLTPSRPPLSASASCCYLATGVHRRPQHRTASPSLLRERILLLSRGARTYLQEPAHIPKSPHGRHCAPLLAVIFTS